MKPPLRAGTMVDRYLVEGLVGRGGMAAVYRVRHAELGTIHALKVLLLSGRSLEERTLQEGRIQANLRHPNVVAVTDVVRVDGAPALVMEYVRGPSLAILLQQHRPTLEQADDLVRGILAGVAAAHDRGMVHRDLKPGNVLLEAGSDRVIPRVTDFGLARLLGGIASPTGTASGVPLGTPSYMAPEQFRSARDVDHRADVFSLGAVLYELVAGAPAFARDEAEEVRRRVGSGRFVPVREREPRLPHRMERAIHGALEPDRDRRIPDCRALLETWCGGASSGQPGPSPWSPADLERVRALEPEAVTWRDVTPLAEPPESPSSGAPLRTRLVLVGLSVVLVLGALGGVVIAGWILLWTGG